MASDLLYQDVIPYFVSANDALAFIKATGLSAEDVPKWTKMPFIKLQVGERTETTRILQEKGYYIVSYTRNFKFRQDHCGTSVALAEKWLLAIAHCGFEWYRRNPHANNAQALKSVGLRTSATPLTAMAEMIYANQLEPTTIACYMDGSGKCFMYCRKYDSDGWTPFSFEVMLNMMSLAAHGILITARSNVVRQLEEAILTKKYNYQADRDSDVAVRDELLKMGEAQLSGMAHLDINNEIHVNAIRRILLKNGEFLKGRGAFD